MILSRERGQAAVLGALSIGLTALVYGVSLSHGFVLFDDLGKILENPVVTGYFSADVPFTDRLLTPGQGYVIPVTVAVWGTLHAVGGGEAWIFHLVSMLLHAAVGLQLFLFLRRWSDFWGVVAASLFVLHPVAVEPVAWATGLKDLLAANFALAGCGLFIAGVERGGEPGRTRLAGAALCALLALLSKPTVVLLGGVWLLWLAARRPQGALRAWWTAGGVLAVGLLLGLLGWLGHDTQLGHDAERLSFGDGRALYALGLQLQHLALPTDLHPLYYVAPGSAWNRLPTWTGLAGLAAFGFALWRGRRHERVVLGLSLAGLSYLPVSNLVPVPRLLADSYLYLPLAGVLLAAVPALVDRRILPEPSSRHRLVIVVLCAGLLFTLDLLATRQVRRWGSEEAFWKPMLERWPAWDRAYYGLATVRLRQRKDGEAATLYAQAYARGYRAEHLADFGVALAASGRHDDAECVLVEALHHGNRRDESLRNYARLLASTPGRALRYPDAARRLVPRAMAAIAKRPGRHRRVLLARLERRRQALGPPGAPTLWPRGRCPLVRPRRR